MPTSLTTEPETQETSYVGVGNQASSGYAKLGWDIAVLEAKLGLEPSIPKAQFFAKRYKVASLFTPAELQDNGVEPSKREIQAKIDQLQLERTLEKLSELRRFVCKELKEAVKYEVLRLHNRIKKLEKDATDTEVKDQTDISTELKYTKNIDLDIFSRSMIGAVVRKNRLLADHPHLKTFQTSISYKEAFTNDTKELGEEKSELLVAKISQRLLSSKILSSASARVKDELFEHFGLNKKEAPKKTKPASKSDEVHPENSAKDTLPSKKKVSKKSAQKNMSESLFVGKLGDFDEEDQDFKELYGIKGKNRPGQRQRRKMIEEKYGHESNHIKANSKSKPTSFQPQLDTQPKLDKRPLEKLHPSWEAKKQLRLKISLSDPPKNNKIVFD